MKFAKFISIIGHPLLTIPLFTAIVMFRFNDLKTAAIVTFLIIGCVFVPMILIMYFKSRNGSYTNFDVSDKKQRRSLFFFAVPLLLTVTIILFSTGQTRNLCLSVLFALILLIISQVVNYFVKSSLHVSFNIYLAALISAFDYKIGIAVLLFTGLLCWSRVKLDRHTVRETIYGLFLGTCISFIMLISEGYIKIR